MMSPTVTYLGMIVAHDMGARSFLPPTMVIVGSGLVVFSGAMPAPTAACRARMRVVTARLHADQSRAPRAVQGRVGGHGHVARVEKPDHCSG